MSVTGQWFSPYTLVSSTNKTVYLDVHSRTFYKREHMPNRKQANTRFRIAAIYPSVNIQPLIKIPKIDTLQKFELSTLVVIGTDCRGSCKSNYHTITITTVPVLILCLFGSLKFNGIWMKLNYFTFQSFDYKRSWCRLFQKRAARTKFDIYVFIWNEH